MEHMKHYLLEMEHITKEFPGVRALDDVSFQLLEGEVHALMGENGAGKSTLMKILSGLYTADLGSISIDGKKVEITSPAKAIEYGIGMVHQEMSNVPYMTVAENIYLGREPKRGGLVDYQTLNNNAEKYLQMLEFSFKASTKMMQLSVSNQQIVEIAKALSQNARIIVFDEPTSSLTEDEVERLFNIIGDLKKKGVGIIYISHKMDEIFRISDRITVLRDGQYIDTRPAAEYTEDSLIEQMVGRTLDSIFPKYEAEISDVVLEVKDLTVDRLFENVSFNLRKGEILGFAGLIGTGRTEVMETIFGLHKSTKGSVYLNGDEVKITHPEQAMKKGIVYISEDRKKNGINPTGSVAQNMTISSLNRISSKGILNLPNESKCVEEYIKLLSIKTPSQKQKIRNLSGGNQQKVIIARGMLTQPSVFILDEPTRGVDVGAKAEIHALISQLAQNGMAVILISSEMDEVMGMSDRIIVMHEGHVEGELQRNEFEQERILNLASGLAQKGRTGR